MCWHNAKARDEYCAHAEQQDSVLAQLTLPYVCIMFVVDPEYYRDEDESFANKRGWFLISVSPYLLLLSMQELW